MSTPESAVMQALDRAVIGMEPARTIEEALVNASLEVRSRAAEIAAEKLSPERLVEIVSQGDSYLRRSMAMQALRQAGEKALDALEAGVRRQNHETALFCIQVLGGIDSTRARARLRELVRHPDLLLAQAAVEALGEQRDPEAVPLLLAMIADDLEVLEANPWRALTAVIALGRIGRSEALPALLRLRRSDVFRETVEDAVAKIRRSSGALA